jgi:hypothetical protein
MAATEPEQELPHTQNMYAARESVHRFVPCRRDGRQSLPAFRVRLLRVFYRLRRSHPDRVSKKNSQFLFSPRRLNIFSFLELCLLPDAVQGADTKIVAGLARNSNQSRLPRMLVLPMTASSAIKSPSVALSSLITSRTFILRPVAKPHAFMAIPYTLFAASSMASARVGCAWIVHIKSSTVASSSMAATASAISSVACGPMM